MKEIKLLEVGDKAPEFEYRTSDDVVCNTKDLKESLFVVYFYPKDNTPGCNKEACGFRDNHPDFSDLGVTVIGVSCDSDKSHAKFREKFNLPFALASDEDQKIVNAYGVWGKKKFMGKTYEGIHRVSYLVGKDERILKVYPKVKPEAHVEEVMEDVKAFINI